MTRRPHGIAPNLKILMTKAQVITLDTNGQRRIIQGVAGDAPSRLSKVARNISSRNLNTRIVKLRTENRAFNLQRLVYVQRGGTQDISQRPFSANGGISIYKNTMSYAFKISISRIFICLFFGGGVSVSTHAQTKPTSSAQVRTQNEDLRKDFLDLRKEVETLKAKLEFDEYLLNTKQVKTDSISLDLTQRSYQRLDTDTGFFLVSVEEALPYLNGYKIRLSVGNPSNATYKRLQTYRQVEQGIRLGKVHPGVIR